MALFEVLTMGRVGVDLYPPQTGVGPEDGRDAHGGEVGALLNEGFGNA